MEHIILLETLYCLAFSENKLSCLALALVTPGTITQCVSYELPLVFYIKLSNTLALGDGEQLLFNYSIPQQ